MTTRSDSVIFTGAATALITPFADGKVDYPSLAALVERQIAGGIDALVFAGTTGEICTISEAEHKALLSFAVRAVGRRVPVIAGVGSNNTSYAVRMAAYAHEVGCDAILAITPYYNKATPEGLVRHFFAIADASPLPVILYHVPPRTGCTIPVGLYPKLCEHPNIRAVKEASGDLAYTARILAACGERLTVYSGNDDRIVPVMSLGGKGVISVYSGILPERAHELCRRMLAGDTKGAARMQLEDLSLMEALFAEINPIPVKAASAMLGYCSPELRLPLCPARPETEERLREELGKRGMV